MWKSLNLVLFHTYQTKAYEMKHSAWSSTPHAESSRAVLCERLVSLCMIDCGSTVSSLTHLSVHGVPSLWIVVTAFTLETWSDLENPWDSSLDIVWGSIAAAQWCLKRKRLLEHIRWGLSCGPSQPPGQCPLDMVLCCRCGHPENCSFSIWERVPLCPNSSLSLL